MHRMFFLHLWKVPVKLCERKTSLSRKREREKSGRPKMHTHTHHTHTLTHTDTHTHACTQTHTHTHLPPPYTHTYSHRHTHTCMHTDTHTHHTPSHLLTQTHTHTHAHTHTHHTHSHHTPEVAVNVISFFNPSRTVLPPGPPRSSGQLFSTRGPSEPSVLVRDGQESVLFFLHVFSVGVLSGGNPCEHGENMQTPHRKARETHT